MDLDEFLEMTYFVVGLIVFLGCSYLLWTLLRVGVISGVKTKGAKGRIRSPDPEGVRQVCGFEPPAVLVEFYRTADVIRRCDFHLVDTQCSPPKGWAIANFIPIARPDAKEWRMITKVAGLPLANKIDGGMYYLAKSGGIYLSDRRNHTKDRLVADSAEAFCRFVPMETPADEADEDEQSNS